LINGSASETKIEDFETQHASSPSILGHNPYSGHTSGATGLLEGVGVELGVSNSESSSTTPLGDGSISPSFSLELSSPPSSLGSIGYRISSQPETPFFIP
jgi:hypothetical protein